MSEKAIRFIPENIDKILATESIRPDVLAEKMKEFGPGNLYERTFGYRHYYIPSHTTFYGAKLTWTIIRSDALERCFDYDHDKIETEFVDITQHSPI